MPQQKFNWPRLDRVFTRFDLMNRVLGRLGIPQVMAARHDKGRAIHEARTRCLHCSKEAECRQWLETSGSRPPPPGFCPNAVLFRKLRKHS